MTLAAVDPRIGAEAFLAAVLECVAQPVWVVDHDGRIRFANPAALEALGYEHVDELLGRDSHALIHHHRPDGTAYPADECPMLLPCTTGQPVSSELDWFFRGDGSMFPVSYTSVPIDMPDGRGAVVAFSDVQERRESEQVLQERDAILASVIQPVWVTDHAGRLRYANRAALDVLGYDDLGELLGKPAHATVHHKRPDGSPYPVEECPVTYARERGERTEVVEDHWVRRDGSFVLVSYSVAPIQAPDGTGAAVAFTDVGERRRAEQALHERDIARARAAELDAARRRMVEAADGARRRVTRDLHDGAQQSFVNAVISLQLAQRKLETDPERARQLLEEGIERARTGIEELRELAAGIHPALLSTRGLEAAVGALADRLPVPVDVRASLTELPDVVAASAYFVVSEALTNVVKHAGASNVVVVLRVRERRLEVEVADDGRGGAHMDGSGLPGLADRVAALGGQLRLDSVPGRGTTLEAVLPLPAEPAPSGVVRAAVHPSADAFSARLLKRFESPGLVGEIHSMRFFANRYHASEGHPGDVRELVTVQRGRLRAGPLDEQVELGPGDFLDYSASGPHAYEALGGDTDITMVMLTQFEK